MFSKKISTLDSMMEIKLDVLYEAVLLSSLEKDSSADSTLEPTQQINLQSLSPTMTTSTLKLQSGCPWEVFRLWTKPKSILFQWLSRFSTHGEMLPHISTCLQPNCLKWPTTPSPSVIGTLVEPIGTINGIWFSLIQEMLLWEVPPTWDCKLEPLTMLLLLDTLTLPQELIPSLSYWDSTLNSWLTHSLQFKHYAQCAPQLTSSTQQE